MRILQRLYAKARSSVALASSASLKLLRIQCHNCYVLSAEAAHQFSPQANDWGFTSFASHQEVFTRNSGFVVNDSLQMNVVVRVDRPEDLYYDSKKSTGYVGLKNQGATCYMNSLLQTLYNINYFRQVFVLLWSKQAGL